MTVASQRPLRPRSFLLLLGGAALFVWLSSRHLPLLVASHFDAAGTANGHLPRDAYTGLMMAMVVLVPLALVLLPNRAFAAPGARINLPNADYWLAPQQREQTIAALSRETTRFAALVLVFLCYAQALVVRANAQSPPNLSTPWLVGGLIVFLLSTLLWVLRLLRKFRLPPR